jgi:tetratricopeptide (TPR) repeat protein
MAVCLALAAVAAFLLSAGNAGQDIATVMASVLAIPGAVVLLKPKPPKSPPSLTPPPAGLAVIQTLPADLASFTGRRAEMEPLLALPSAGHAPGVIDVAVIDGMPGVGKTAFAVHAAHQLAPGFPDGQFFLHLHGHTPGLAPIAAEDALFELLREIGVGPRQIPAGLEARARLWRDRVAGHRILLLLDDATTTDQVRPLLPGSAGTLVLITSRRRLSARPESRPITVDVLAAAEAAQLFVRLASRPGLGPADVAVTEIVAACGRLPLAISLMAGQLEHHPAWTAAHLAADLGSAANKLAMLTAEEASVSAAFGLSYGNLSPRLQQLFRRLGLHPGSDIDAYAAAALDGTDPDTARSLLDELFNYHMLDEPTRGRYRLHDLIRLQASTLAATDSASGRNAAQGRLQDYYLQTARAADRQIGRRVMAGIGVPAGATDTFTPDLPSREAALAWLDAERFNLDAAISQGAQQGWPRHAIGIATAIHSFLRSRGHWLQALRLHAVALSAARQIGDRRMEAATLLDLGAVQRLTGDLAAADCLGQALDLYRALGDRLGEATALDALGLQQRGIGNYPAAADRLGQALDLYQALGDRLGEATALTNLGAVQNETGNYLAAADSLGQALSLYRDSGDRHGQANALNDLATTQHIAGRHREAACTLGQALELYRALGDRLGELTALTNLGEIQRLAGDYPAAADSLGQARKLGQDLGDRQGRANALHTLGEVQRLAGDGHEALRSQASALELYRALGDRPGQANALAYLGTAQQDNGDTQTARASLGAALSLYQDLGDLLGQAEVLNTMGDLSLAAGALSEARARYTAGLRIAAGIAGPLEKARALEGIGRCHLQAARSRPGAAMLRRALAIYQQIGSPQARQVEKTLNELS